jgi:hypothetical protein
MTRRWIGAGLALLAAPPTAFFGLLYYEGYWRWRGRFNSEGRYFDAEDAVVHHVDAEVLILPLALFLALAGLGLMLALWPRPRLPSRTASAPLPADRRSP